MAAAPWRREEYADLLPEVPHVGWCLSRKARPNSLSPHTHPGGWELCWIRRGTVDWWAGNETWEVPQGSIYITRPGELHGATHTVHEPCELFWIQVRCGQRLVPTAVADELKRAPRVFPGNEHITTAFWDVLREHRKDAPLRLLAARAALHRLLSVIVRAAHGSTRQPDPSPAITRALVFGSDQLEERVTVGQLAAAAGLSSSRFHARFLTETGQTPADWLRRARLRRAKRLLATTDRPVTTIAFDLGFPTSQHFATVFRGYTGFTPTAWRNSVGSGPT
ncbi:MAG: AraC family transcriptional regulator [Planctomycetota bacterium]